MKCCSSSISNELGNNDLIGVTLRIGDATLDFETRQIVRGGEPMHLSPKAYQLLRILIEHRPRVISKRDLHEQLWSTTFVSEANLPSLIAEIRVALGDAARGPKFIRTAHRVGYAFCGDVVEIGGAESQQTAPAFCWLLNEGRRFPLRQGENVLGRNLDDGVSVPSPTVSRRHARISIVGDEASVEDLGSKNGTYVNGAPVLSPVLLKNGDELRTGSVAFRFRMTTPRGPTATWNGTNE
jgi:DNA-binding winged helix-turn-helix (wHTH) protein